MGNKGMSISINTKQILMGARLLCWEDFAAKKLAQEGKEQVSINRPPVPPSPPNQTGIPVTTEILPTTRDLCGNGSGVYTLFKPTLKWNLSKAPIYYYIDPSRCNHNKIDPPGVLKAIHNAFASYNSVISSKQIFQPTTDPLKAKIKIYWAYHDNAMGQLAICNYNFYPTTGQMISASIKFDSSDGWFINPNQQCGYSGSYFDIENVAAHEIGHALGFSHCFNDLESTMYPTIKRGESFKRSLDRGTLTGLKFLYGYTV